MHAVHCSVMDPKKVDSFEKLAGMVQRGFAAVDDRFAAVDVRFDAIDARFDKVDAELRSIRSELSYSTHV